ncbi:barstar family protein [Psychroserpens sp. XS_ASV72]|uniref:barstar family protein n=1 Tax=Psychroserpens sp. XS_ASV72 TaxID=3241293 RepID=UPI0035183D23
MLRKEIKNDNELYLYFNDKLIYKRWLNQGYSKVFDRFAYGKGTFMSITEDENGKIKRTRKIFIDGELCYSKLDFWKRYISDFDFQSKKDFGKNLDAFNDAITAEGPGFPGDCIIEITGSENLKRIFGNEDFEFIIELLREAKFVKLILEKTD